MGNSAVPEYGKCRNTGGCVNVTVLACCLNEEKFLDRFIRKYGWADNILFADGGSTDRSREIIAGYQERRHRGVRARVEVRDFPERIYHDEIPELYRNPKSAGVQFLIDWANAEMSHIDWFILDDVDCVPNVLLQQTARTLFQGLLRTMYDGVYAYRLYLWGPKQYFPDLNKPGPSLWAWRPKLAPVRMDLSNTTVHQQFIDDPKNWYSAQHPFCLLHTPWPDIAAWEKKKEWYANWGEPQLHPLDACGELRNLPWFAQE